MADTTPPGRVFAFRRALTVDPVIIPVASLITGVPVAIDQANLRGAGVTSFKISNATPYWVWYRGWNGAAGDMPTIKEKGHYLAPGATDLNTSQVPMFIAAVAQAEPGVPAATNADGSTLTVPGRLVMVYGSGM